MLMHFIRYLDVRAVMGGVGFQVGTVRQLGAFGRMLQL